MAAAASEYAAQESANAIFMPCAIGWSLQLFLCGIATDRARAVLFRKKTSTRYIGTVPLARPLLACATIFNMLAGGAALWDIMAWLPEQNRSYESLNGFKFPDAVSPLLAAIVAATVQSFMAYRCWRLAKNSIYLAILVGSGIALALAGAIWTFVESVHFWQGTHDADAIFLPTQIMLWTSAIVDIIITVALSMQLSKMKRGWNTATDHFIDSLVRLSFETCFAPAFFSVLAACLYASLYNRGDLWNIYIAVAACIPSLYVISMLYCLEGTARSKRRMETSKSGPPITYPSKGGATTASNMPDIRKVHLPLHQTTSLQWDPPSNWQSQLGQGEDVEDMSDGNDQAFGHLRKGERRDSSKAEAVPSKRITLHDLVPQRPANAQRKTARTSDGITVVVEKFTAVDEDR